MNVLLICGGDHKYGSPKSAINLIEAISKSNNDIRFVVLTQNSGKINEYCNMQGIPNYVTGHRYAVYMKESNRTIDIFKHSIRFLQFYLWLAVALFRINRWVDVKKIDLIHTNIDRDVLGLFLAHKYSIPHVVHLRELIKSHYGLEFLLPNQIEFMNRFTNHFVAISDSVACEWESLGLSKEKISTVYNGIIAENYECSDRKDCSDDLLDIVMVGGLFPEKGQLELIQALSLIDSQDRNGLKVDFYGDGRPEYEQLLKKYSELYNLKHVVSFKGYRTNVTQILSKYDVGVLCSKAEGFGLTTVEYMYAGLCPLVADTGASPEIVIDGECGLLYSYGRPDDLAKKIIFLKNNRILLRNLAKNAQERAEKMFSMDRCGQNIISLYEKVLCEQGKRIRYE